MTLAVVILTKNEEINIVEVIENVRQCTEEILVIDSGSTDKTVELAEQHGAKVLYRAWDNDFAAQRNFALDKTSADWILYIDADERLTSEAVEHIKKILVEENQDFQYRIKRKTTAFGKTFNYGVLKPDYVLRMFPRSKVEWEGKVHEHAKCPCKIKSLQGYIKHYTYRDWISWEKKSQMYSTIWANNARQNGKRATPFDATAHAVFGFFKMYILKLGFLDGWYGLFVSMNHYHNEQMKYLKLMELS